MSRQDSLGEGMVISKLDTQGEGTAVGGVLGFLSAMLNDLLLDLEEPPTCLGVETPEISRSGADEVTLLTALVGRCCVQLVRSLAAELAREEAADGTRVDARDTSASLAARAFRSPFL